MHFMPIKSSSICAGESSHEEASGSLDHRVASHTWRCKVGGWRLLSLPSAMYSKSWRYDTTKGLNPLAIHGQFASRPTKPSAFLLTWGAVKMQYGRYSLSQLSDFCQYFIPHMQGFMHSQLHS